MGLALKGDKRFTHILAAKEWVCGGRSIIEGTRISVWSLIIWYKTGMSIEERFLERIFT